MGPYGGLSLRGGQQAALPLIGTWNFVGFNETGDSSLVSYKCKKNKVVVILSTMHISDITFGKEPKNCRKSSTGTT